MSWLDRIEDEHGVWIDAGVERLVPADARGEGSVEVDQRPSPTCAARVRAYVGSLRARRTGSSDSVSEKLLR